MFFILFKAFSNDLFVKVTVGLKPIEYDIISPLKVSKIGDKYIFFSLFLILNSVISVSHNLFGLSALKFLLTILFAIFPTVPLYELYFLTLFLNFIHKSGLQ